MEKEQEISAELFALLVNKDLDDASKQQINKLVEDNPGILVGKNFAKHLVLPYLVEEYEESTSPADLISRSSTALHRTHRVLENLRQLKQEGYFPSIKNPTKLVAGEALLPNGETLATQAIKDMAFLNVVEKRSDWSSADQILVKRHHNEYGAFLHQLYSDTDTNKSYGCDRSQPNAKGQKPKDLVGAANKARTLDDLRKLNYIGTLTIEQAEQLRKLEDAKKVADMKNIPGDKKKSKNESSDKFRDEDVVKYMYENWFLGGMSSIFNKLEDITLNTLNGACDAYLERVERQRKLENDAALDKISTFTTRTTESMNNLEAECKAKDASFSDIIKDLRDNLDNPHPKWKYYQPDDPFIKQLQSNPDQAKMFLDSMEQELKNRVTMVNHTGKLAMNITAIEMTNEFMQNDKAWRKQDKKATFWRKDGKKSEYLSDDELHAQFVFRSRQKQQKILEAIAVISEDTRLLAEAEYDQLSPAKPGEQRPSLQEYIQQRTNKEVNNFLTGLSELSQKATEAQGKSLTKRKEDKRFAANINVGMVQSQTNRISKIIRQKIQNGAIYNDQIFKDEHSKERIVIKTSLYDAAIAETSPGSMQNIMQKMKELNTYNQQTLQARRNHAEERKKQLEIFRTRLERRNSVFPMFHKKQRE